MGPELAARDRAGLLALARAALEPEHGWDGEAFLTAACRKAGLSPQAWHDGATAVFAEEEEG